MNTYLTTNLYQVNRMTKLPSHTKNGTLYIEKARQRKKLLSLLKEEKTKEKRDIIKNKLEQLQLEMRKTNPGLNAEDMYLLSMR